MQAFECGIIDVKYCNFFLVYMIDGNVMVTFISKQS